MISPKSLQFSFLCIVMAVLSGGVSRGAEPEPKTLPAPRRSEGMPLLEALAKRHSAREFGSAPLTEQVLSDLLWAAFGVNRPEAGMRTAPSAVNWQEIEILVAAADGLWSYDAVRQRLKPVLRDDIRAEIGLQPYVARAPVCLLYVADLARMTRASAEDQAFYSACDVGFISQNVYLFCASEGLNTCVVGLVKRKALADRLKLRPEQRLLLVQPVGYPPAPGEAAAEP